mgnify:CR=1 FL=1
MSERFPGIMWFCDRCNACLSEHRVLMPMIMYGNVQSAVIRIAFLQLQSMNLRMIQKL